MFRKSQTTQSHIIKYLFLIPIVLGLASTSTPIIPIPGWLAMSVLFINIVYDLVMHESRKYFLEGRYHRMKSALAAEEIRAYRPQEGKDQRVSSLSALIRKLFYNPVLDTDNVVSRIIAGYMRENVKDLAGSLEFEDGGIGGEDWRYDDCVHYSGTLGLRTELGVLQVILPRKMPNLIFDSKRVGGRNLRFNFDKNQKVALEGNFSDYFDMYFPAHYQIDATDIVSPTVMEALLEATDYEIEIYQDTLYLFAPPFEAEALPEAVKKAWRIRDALNARANVYRDQRTGNRMTPQEIDSYGLKIQSNYLYVLTFWAKYVLIIFIGVLTIIFGNPIMFVFLPLLAIGAIWFLVRTFFIERHQATRERRLRYLRHYGRKDDIAASATLSPGSLTRREMIIMIVIGLTIGAGVGVYITGSVIVSFFGIGLGLVVLGSLGGRVRWIMAGVLVMLCTLVVQSIVFY